MAAKENYMNSSLSVSNNMAVGGQMKVAGSTTIGHNLKVEGWLDAKNIKGANKGVFNTVDALNAAYPNPEPGWFAGVGTSIPCALYLCRDGRWEPTGGTMTISTDVSAYGQMIQNLSDDVAQLANKVAELDESVVHIRQVTDNVDTGLVVNPGTGDINGRLF